MATFNHKLTGTNFRGKETVEFVSKMTPGDSVMLVRDAANEHDKNAIRVHAFAPDDSNTIDIGFIGRPHNAKLARFMDDDPDASYTGKFGYLGSGKSKIPAIQVEIPDED